jgi:hypothetical protein
VSLRATEFAFNNSMLIEECHLPGGHAMWLLLRTNISEEQTTSIIMVRKISELGKKFAVTIK